MNYVTVFDISKQQFEWWWPAIGILIFALGIVCIKFVSRWPSQNNAKIIGWVMLVLGPLFSVLIYNSQTTMWAGLRRAYDRGAYPIVEGVVHDFRPMWYEGHPDECFWVENRKFCYSDYVGQPGFRQSASHGGPIREGLPVRITYHDGQILRLDVRADSLAPEADRIANAKAEQARAQERLMNEPFADRMNLGFLFAVVVMFFLYNLDWRRQISYWIRRDPPYSSLLELGFRAFFVLSFVAAAVRLFQLINEKHRSAVDFEKAALLSLIWIAIFGVSEFVIGRRRPAPNQPANTPAQPASGS